MPTPRRVAVSLVALSLLAAACGDDDTASSAPSDAERTVDVEMRDIAFSPTTIEVETGETVRFVFDNTGQVKHEAYLGDAAAQEDHADEMSSMGDMDHGDDDVLVVEPGEVGELTHTFDEAGTVQLGCHEPGHYEAGMVMDVDVS